MTPRHEDTRRLLWLLDTPLGLAAMFAAGLIVRVALAPHFGFYGGYDGCIRERWVPTPYGLVLRPVNVCY